MPSLGTATKLARGLRELREDADTAQYLGLVAAGAVNPTARVEYALRADEMLSEPQVRQIMEYYLAVRMRRFGRAFQPAELVPAAAAPARRTIAAPGAAGQRTGRRRRRAGDAGDSVGTRPMGRSMGDAGTALDRPYSFDYNQGTARTALHVRVSGTANAGVWGAGVRIHSARVSARSDSARQVHRDPAIRRRLRTGR